MIGFFQNFEDIRSWALGRAVAQEAEFAGTGSLVTLGYAMAMRDIARSEMGADARVPGYQRDVEIRSANVVDLFPEMTAAA